MATAEPTAEPTGGEPALGVLHAWLDAFNAGDAAAIAALYHPQAVLWGTTATGLIDTPAAVTGYFGRVFALRPAPRMALHEVRARRHGDTAIATGGYHLTLPVDGTVQTRAARFSFTCVPADGGWRIADHHSSWMPAT